MKYQTTIDQIAETMNNARSQGKGITLLLGSGCSTKAGIPDAAGLVKVIKKDFPKVYEGAENKNYHTLNTVEVSLACKSQVGAYFIRCFDATRVC
jgi:hypothetical protein